MENKPEAKDEVRPPEGQETPKEPAKPSVLRTRDFWVGVGSCVVLNGVLGGLAAAFPRAQSPIGYIALVLNLGLLVLLAIKWPKVAVGYLGVIAFVMFLVLCVAPLVIVAICFSQGSL